MRSWGWSPNDGISFLITGDGRELAYFLSAVRGHSEKATISKPGRESSPESDYAGTIFQNFWPPTCEKKKKNSLKTSSLWYFVMGDSTDWDETPSGSCKVTISTFIHLYFYCAWSGCRNFSQMLRLLETTMLITLQMLVLIASLEKKCVCLIIDII